MQAKVLTHFFAIILLCIIAPICQAQFLLKGKVINQADHNPIVAATIILQYVQDEKISQSARSDSLGNFSFQTQSGDYLLMIDWKDIPIYNNSISIHKDTNLNDIIVDTTFSETLSGVEVVAHKSSIKMEMGKLIYTPAQISTLSAFDVLKTAPGILATDNSISLIGKGTPNVMINGRWERMNMDQIIIYLKSLPSNKVKHIEIVRNPGAEQDAENRNGYINIVLKENREQGIQGSASMSIGKATYWSVMPNVNLTANLGRLQLNTNLGLSDGKNRTIGSNILHYPDKYWREDNLQVRNMQSKVISFTADYEINNKQTVGASVNYNQSKFTSNENNASQIFNAAQTQIDSTLQTRSWNPEQLNNYGFNINYLYKIDSSNQKVRFDLDHFYQSYDRHQTFSNSKSDANGASIQDPQSFMSGNDQKMLITTANLSIDQKTAWMLLNYGAKYSYISNRNLTSFFENKNEIWEPDQTRFDNFTYDEATYAIFAKGSKAIKKWNITAGLRLEHTQTLGISKVYAIRTPNSYTKLFPSSDISYQPNENNLYSLSYSRRIDRPSFGQMNPFRWYHTQYAFTNGNPSLQPYFSHNLDWNYILKQKWYFNVSYSKYENMFSEYDIADPLTFMRETRVENILNSDVIGASVYAQLNLWNHWLLVPQVGIYYTTIDSKVDFLAYSAGTLAYLSFYQQINLDKNKRWLIDLNTYYYAPRNYGLMQFKTMWAQSVRLAYNTADNNWNFTLAANDIFKTGAMRYNSLVNNLLREREVYRDQRSLWLTVRYNFNKGTNKAQRKSADANSEEMRRTGG